MLRPVVPLFIIVVHLTGPAAGEGMTASAVRATGFPVSTSISINAPMQATDEAGRAAEEADHRKALYARAVGECAVLLDTIATACEITGISLSTQVNRSPGQPDCLYATANVSMQVALN